MNEKIREVMADILGIDGSEISDDFAPDSTDSWDSLNNLRLITAFESAFEIKFTMSEINAMTDFAKIASTIKRRVAENQSQNT